MPVVPFDLCSHRGSGMEGNWRTLAWPFPLWALFAPQNSTGLHQELLRLHGENTVGFRAWGCLLQHFQSRTMMLLGLWRGNGDNPSLGCTLWMGRQDTWVSALSGLWLQDSGLALPPCLYPWASGAPSTTWLFCLLCISNHLCCQQFLCSALCQGGCYRLSAATSQGREFNASRAPDSLRVK